MASAFVVYWLHNKSCTTPSLHGYIGATSNLKRRFHQHIERDKFPAFEMTVIFTGTREACLDLEFLLRPRPGIGWNAGVGGFPDGRAIRGVPKTPEHRAKQRAAALQRWADPTKRAMQSASVKKALADVDRSGANNSRFGTHCSEAAKQKMREKIAERGGVTGANNPNWKGGRPAH